MNHAHRPSLRHEIVEGAKELAVLLGTALVIVAVAFFASWTGK